MIRLGGMAKKGCSSLMLQLEGNRHDVQGRYAFLETSFRGCLPADNGQGSSKNNCSKFMLRRLAALVNFSPTTGKN
jgi:hypothetical protein